MEIDTPENINNAKSYLDNIKVVADRTALNKESTGI